MLQSAAATYVALSDDALSRHDSGAPRESEEGRAAARPTVAPMEVSDDELLAVLDTEFMQWSIDFSPTDEEDALQQTLVGADEPAWGTLRHFTRGQKDAILGWIATCVSDVDAWPSWEEDGYLSSLQQLAVELVDMLWTEQSFYGYSRRAIVTALCDCLDFNEPWSVPLHVYVEDPNHILACPITKQIPMCPVVAADGRTYEKTAVEGLFDVTDDAEFDRPVVPTARPVSPYMGGTMASRKLYLNRLLQRIVRDGGLLPDGGIRLSYLLCHGTQRVMTDPVVCADGYTYDRSAVERGHPRQPPYPDHVLRTLIDQERRLAQCATLLIAIPALRALPGVRRKIAVHATAP